MALNSTIALGGGAAQSGTATPGSYAMAECDTCGAVADTLYMGWSPLCFRCEQHARESAEERDYQLWLERQGEIAGRDCDDCGEKKATCLFLHLDGRRFVLCDSCFFSADHEDDYLMFCECSVPERRAGNTHCQKCVFQIRSERVHRDDALEEQEPAEEDANGFTFDFLDREDDADSAPPYEDDDDGPAPPPEEEVRYCGCPVPCREFKDDVICFFCHGTI